MPPAPEWPSSLWNAVTAPRAAAAPLRGTIEADAVVVGGGMCGLSTALHLARGGLSTVVLEGFELGWGASGRNNGQVIPTMSAVEPDALVRRFGETGERFVHLIAQSATTLFDLARDEKIDCEAEQTGWYQPAHSPGRVRLSENRVATWRRFGAPAELLDRDASTRLLGTDFWHGGMFNPTGGHINPLAFVRGLAAACERRGVVIHEHSIVTGYARDGDGWRVATAHGAVRARTVVLATNAYTDALTTHFERRIARSVVPILSWQMSTPPLNEAVRAALVPGRQAVSDTRADLRFFRYDARNRLVTGGSVLGTHKAAARVAANASARMAEAFPGLEGVRFTHVWNGRVGITLDRHPHIHRLAPDLWSWVGCNGRGVALSVALGRELARAIRGEPLDTLALPVTDVDPMPFYPIARRVAPFVLAWLKRRDHVEINPR